MINRSDGSVVFYISVGVGLVKLVAWLDERAASHLKEKLLFRVSASFIEDKQIEGLG